MPTATYPLKFLGWRADSVLELLLGLAFDLPLAALWILSPRRQSSPRDIWERCALEVHNRMGTGRAHEFVEARRHPRFKLDTNIRIYPRNRAVVRGHTVDISESGISAMLKEEVPIGEVVRLELNLTFGDVETHALVRQRNAFRYGFEFVESSSAHDIIGRTCRLLAVEQAVQGPAAQDPKTT